MNLTGGLHWHWRAWRAQAMWAQTRADIETWLLAQPVPTDHLILIGASAGWMMSLPWLTRFKSLQTWDIDPLAGRLFKWRHGLTLKARGVRLQCHTGDALTQLPHLLREQPQATIFFDNVLGQIRFQNHSIPQAEKRLHSITQALRGRHWGSVHDRMSGPVISAWPEHALPNTPLTEQGSPDEEAATQAWLGLMGAQSPWLDHLTGSVFPAGTTLTHIAWPMKTQYWHWLQAGWVSPNKA
jgi:hypothetical protein